MASAMIPFYIKTDSCTQAGAAIAPAPPFHQQRCRWLFRFQWAARIGWLLSYGSRRNFPDAFLCNGYRGFVETVTEAWQRVGLLKNDETFDRERYVACADKAVADLQAEKFITSRTVNFYREQARTMPLPAK